MYQVKEQRGPKLKEEEALSGATFDGVIIAILIFYLNFLRLLPLSPQKYFCLSQNHAVELGLADSLFSSMKVTFIHIYSRLFTCQKRKASVASYLKKPVSDLEFVDF